MEDPTIEEFYRRLAANAVSNYGMREDGTFKGQGWLGNISKDPNKAITELSIGVNFDGKERLIPAVVPSLSKEEIEHLGSGGDVTDSIVKKAVDFAKTKIAQNQSPFAESLSISRIPLNANLLEGGTISAQPRPQSTLEAWYSGIKNFANETLAPMSRVGSAMLGKTTLDSYPQIDEINDPKTLRLAQAKDVLGGVLNYSAGPTLLGKPTMTGLSAAGARAETKSPLWRSQMQDVLAQKLPGKGDPKQIAQTIESFAKKGEFKPEELEWSGVRDWLSQQSGKVSKDDVLNYMRENNVQVQEVVKGGISPAEKAKLDAFDERIKNGEKLNREERVEYNRLTDRELYPNSGDASTVYGQYQLPGGENYRELLLTLPERQKYFNLPEGYSVQSLNGRSDQYTLVGPDNVGHRLISDSRGDANQEALELVYGKKLHEKDFRSTHYQEPNILAHIRFNERVDADGKRVLFIEEIQSDWAQKGRKEGFKTQDRDTKNLVATKTADGYWEVRNKNGDFITNVLSTPESTTIPKTAEEAIAEARRRIAGGMEEYGVASDNRIPDAPFVKDTGKWSMLAMKRMVRYAADNGFDRIAWTTGEQQAARYDLSKQVDSIRVQRTALPGGDVYKIIADRNGEKLIDRGGLSKKELAENIGKDLAQKAIEDPKGNIKFEGENLKVGGEGMQGFYDKILPAEVNKFFGKEQWGKARVGETKILAQATNDWTGLKPVSQELPGARFRVTQGENIWQFGSKEAANLHMERLMAESPNIATVHSLDITDAMREKATKEGMPLFQMAGATAGVGAMQKEDNDYAEQAINDRIAQNKALKNGS